MARRHVVTILVLGVAALVFLYFWVVYLHPPQRLCQAVQLFTVTDPPRYDNSTREEEFATRRFNSKLHMLNPLQMAIDYPLAWFLGESVGMARWSWMSANLISLIHPIFGILAGICFAKAAGKLDRSSDSPTSTQEGVTELRRIQSSPSVPSPSSRIADEDAAGSSWSGTPYHERAASNVVEVESAVMLDPSAKKHVSPRPNMRLIRLGCLFFSARNFLDSFDGVIARLQRRYAAANGVVAGPTKTTFGFNGHSLDVITDLTGVILASCGIFVLLYRRGTVISRIPAAALSRIPSLRTRVRSRSLGVFVAITGLVYMACVGGTWETYMIRYSNLFDLHAPSNAELFALENTLLVRLNQFFWSLTCGDTVFSVLIVALFFNYIWEAVQFYCFCGYLWFLFVAAHSVYVWHWAVLSNATAARIVAEWTTS